MADDIEVEIRAMLPTPTGCGIFLEHSDKVIAIFVDHSVAAAITMFMHGVTKPRPLTHDLIGHIFSGLGVEVSKVLINDLQDDTYFARLFLKQSNELGTSLIEIDARPSDSIALALQHKSPVFVKREVWERADDMTWALEQALEDQDSDDTAGPPGLD